MKTIELKPESNQSTIHKIGKSVDFQFRYSNFSVQEYQDRSENNKYIWVCTNKDTKKEVFRGPCRSTAQCIKLVKELLDSK